MNRLAIVALVALVCGRSAASAGMPSVLPLEIQRAATMSDSAMHRFQAISFFLVVLVLSSLAVRAIWNGLRREFPRLPQLSYLRAGGLVLLWGVAMIVVLTMISGARELMTPGAWEKSGFTYRLANDSKSPRLLEERTARLAELRVALLRYAAHHEGRYPNDLKELEAANPELPHLPGLSYLYIAGLDEKQAGRVLVYEPDVDRDSRLALFTGGEIRACSSDELRQLLVTTEGP